MLDERINGDLMQEVGGKEQSKVNTYIQGNGSIKIENIIKQCWGNKSLKYEEMKWEELLKRGIFRGKTKRNRRKSIVCRKVNMSSCGFAPTHIPLDLTKSAHKHSYSYTHTLVLVGSKMSAVHTTFCWLYKKVKNRLFNELHRQRHPRWEG